MTQAQPATSPDGAVVRLLVGASAEQGRGHVGRALAIAEALRARTRPTELALRFGALSDREVDRATALGLTIVDAAVASARPPAVTVVDLPDPNDVPSPDPPSSLVVFDDRHLFRGRAAVIIQPSRLAWTGGATAERVLAGYDVIPIAASYRTLRPAPPWDGSRRPTILVCFGGSDPWGVTARVVATLAGGPWDLTVVLGPSHPGHIDVAGAEIVRDPDDLPARLARCDMAVLGAGTMKFEAACLGRPMVLLAAAEDQLPVGEEFGSTGAARWLGDGRLVDPGTFRTEVEGLLADPTALAALGARARAMVDGRGAGRIAGVIETLVRAPR